MGARTKTRQRRGGLWIALMALWAATAWSCLGGGQDALDSERQAVETPPPDPVPPPPETDGPALAAQPPSAAYLEKRAAFEAAVDEHMPAWTGLGLSEDEIKSKRRKLKDEMLHPKPTLSDWLP